MPYIVCTDNLMESKILFYFLYPEEIQLFKIFSGRITQSFPTRFEIVSIPYLPDLIIRLYMQLFFLKSYEWSLNLKILLLFLVQPRFLLNNAT